MRIYRSILIILILIYPLIVGSSYGQIVVHSEANGVIREEIVTGLNNAETHISFGAPVQRGSLGTVKFRGEVLRGGEDEVNQIISFYHFAIKVTEILEDRSGRISVGSIVGVTSHRSGSARVDASYNGDFVEVYGKYTLETRGMPYYSYASNVELSESFGDGSQYYLIKYQIVPPRPSQTCSVWTDKNEYNIGDKIDVYYSVNKDCTAKLTIILPNGQTTVLGGPNAVPASTRSKQAFAGEPCGKRRVVFETWSSSSASGSPSCRSEWDFTVRCRETCSGTVQVVVYDSITNSPLSGARVSISPSGSSGYTRDGLFIVTGQCPNKAQTVTVILDGYESATETVYTDINGNQIIGIPLKRAIQEERDRCTGVISGGVIDAEGGMPISGAFLRIYGQKIDWSGTTGAYGGFRSSQSFCRLSTYEIECNKIGYITKKMSIKTDENGNLVVTIPIKSEKPDCSGKISGHVFNANNKSPIPGAALLICSDGGSCFPTPLVDSIGLYETGQNTCPSTTYQVTCSANGYKTVTTRVTTDAKGNAWKEFDLVPECSGKISGHVYNADDKSLISGAALLICQDGGSCFPTPLVDSIGLYETGQNTCPSTTYQVTCSANGYRTVTTRVTTDAKGNAWKDFDLELIKKEGNRPPIIKEIMFAPKSPQPLGTINLLKGVGITIAVNAQDPDGDTLKYKFELKEEGGSFRTIKDWSTLPVCSSWKPNKEGEYTIRVSVKDIESETSKEDIYLITDKYYIIISDGIKEYEMGGVTEPVFYLGSAIHVKVYPQPTSEFTYILIHRKSGVQFGKSLVTSDASFYVDVPVQLPIGEYYILIEEVNIQSDPIYIIFNPYTVNGHEVDAFWRSDIIKKYDNFGRFNKNYYTHHFSNSVFKFAIEAADKFTGDISYEKYLGQETSILLIYKDLKVNEVLGTYMPTTDIQELIIKMSNNERIDVDCDIYSYIMISLLRSVGIPSRMVHGQWKTKLVFLEGHAWTEVYFADEGKWKVVDFGITDGGIPLIMDIGSEYVSMLGKEFHQNWNKGSDWHNMYDESGKNRKTDYS